MTISNITGISRVKIWSYNLFCKNVGPTSGIMTSQSLKVKLQEISIQSLVLGHCGSHWSLILIIWFS